MQTEIMKDIFYVGVHGNRTKSDFFDKPLIDTSYNSYLIKGDKTALIETVHSDYAEEFIQKIEKIIPVSNIDYLICNYTGTEYLKSIEQILSKNSEIKVIGTIPAVKNLKEMTNMTFNEHVAKNGETLELGNNKTLEFLIAPCLPWQDTMLTYAHQNEIVFSGRLFASKTAFNACISCEREEYFNEILAPHRVFAGNAIDLIAEKTLKGIFPCHGSPVIKDVQENLKNYFALCRKEENVQVAVFCSEDNKNTMKMACEIVKTLKRCHMSVNLYDVNDKSAVKALNTSDALAFGTPTINKNASKAMWRLLSEADAVNLKGKPYFVFGSYGWSGEGTELVHRFLSQLRMKPFEKPICTVFTPSDSDLKHISEYTSRFADSLKNI